MKNPPPPIIIRKKKVIREIDRYSLDMENKRKQALFNQLIFFYAQTTRNRGLMCLTWQPIPIFNIKY